MGLKKAWESYEKFEGYLTKTGAVVAAGCICGMILAITLTTIGRYFFQINILHVDEFSGYALVFMAYLGFAYGLKSGSHITIELIRSKLPKKIIDGLWVAASFIGLFVIVVYFWFSFTQLLESIRVGERSICPSEAPMWIPRSAICLGWILLFFSMVHLLIVKWCEFKESHMK